MRNPAIILLLVLLQLNGSFRAKESGVKYIKMITLSPSDSITIYNRGYTLGSYLIWSLKSDSIAFSNEADKQFAFSTANMVGLKDTLQQFLEYLRDRPNGDVDTAFLVKGVYCGPTFYVEVHGERETNFYSFILGGNDTLSRFSKCFFNLNYLPEKVKTYRKRPFNADTLAIDIVKGLGYYEDIPVPFLGVRCDAGIDYSKITGAWRTLREKNNMVDSSTYTKLTFKPGDILVYEHIREDTVSISVNMKYEFSKKQNKLLLNSAGYKRSFEVIKITDQCLEYIYNGQLVRYNRL